MSAAAQSSPNWVDPNPNSAGEDPPAADSNSTAFLPALNPPATQIHQLHPHVGLGGGASEPDAHELGEILHHGYFNHHHHHHHGLGQQLPQRPLGVVAQTTWFEQPGLAQGNPGPIASGSGTGTSAVAGPTTAGGIGERTHYQWTGTLQWKNDTKVTRTQVTAIATKGNPLALTWPQVLTLAPAKPTVSLDELQDWIRRTNPVVMRIRSASVTDDPSYGQLVQLLKTKCCYAVSGWEIEGMGRPTTNLLIAVLMQGLLLGAVFPTSGIPEIPKPRFPQLNPAAPQVVSNTLPPVLHLLSTPQLTQGSTQINNLQLMRQKQPLQALNGGDVSLFDAAAIPQQRQPMPQGVAVQMKRLAEQFRPAPGNRGPIVGGNDVGPSNAVSPGEGMDYRWSGTVMWQGIEKKEMRAQVTATAFIGNPLASTWPEVLTLAPAGPAVTVDELRDWIKTTNPMVVQIRPTLGTNGHNYGQLVNLLKEKHHYAVSGWEIQGMGRSTMNLLIAQYVDGPLLGAVFPTTGMPEIPKPRLPPLDPAVHQAIMNVLPPRIRSLPEPQLSQAIRQAYEHQQRSFETSAYVKPTCGNVTLVRWSHTGGRILADVQSVPRQCQGLQWIAPLKGTLEAHPWVKYMPLFCIL